MERILIIGSSGQIGTELVMELRKMYGDDNVIASDIRPSSDKVMNSGPFEELDILDEQLLRKIVKKYQITQVYLLAALLSATSESKTPGLTNETANDLASLATIPAFSKHSCISGVIF